MSKPYSVSWGWCGENEERFDHWLPALLFFALKDRRSGASIVNLDGYDCDCDQDGYFMCSDGLTEDERDQLEDF